MIILGILQNQWFKNPDKIRGILAQHPEYRRRFIARALFAGCQTGRVLMHELGLRLCQQIIWEEASPKIGGRASSNFEPDPKHVQRIIDEVRPDVIVAFGANALAAVYGTMSKAKVYSVPHPAYRRYDIVRLRLAALRRKLEK